MKDKYFIIGKYKSCRFDTLKRNLAIELRKNPQNRFLKVLMADLLENKGQAKKAIEYLHDEDNDEGNSSYYTLFVKARVYQNAERISEAIPIWRMIVSASIKDISKSLELPGLKSARTISNDAKFYLANCLYSQFRDEKALLLVNDHLANRKKGVYSDFTLREVRDYKRMLEWTLSKPRNIVKGVDGYCTDEQRRRIWLHFEQLKKKDEGLAAEYLVKKGREFYNEYYMWTVASEIFFNLKEPALCVKCAGTAYDVIGDDDLLVVYDYASALALNNRFEEALAKFNYILSQDIQYIAYSEHGEGMKEAKKLIRGTKRMIDWTIKRRMKNTNSNGNN